MDLSIIVVVHNMRREAPRTLHSLSAAYQEQVDAGSYEVIVLENGSTSALSQAEVEGFGPNFRYRHLEEARPSPAFAMNLGATLARGRWLGFMIDGARIASPGLVREALLAFRMLPRPVVVTVPWHLGPDVQRKSMLKGYDQRAEDRLLEEIGWPRSGYDLFEIAVPGGSVSRGLFAPLAESGALFVTRSVFEELGGYCERFDLPGGGFLNQDFLARACGIPESELVVLLGQGTFHQIHGGAATNSARDFRGYLAAASAQYEAIRGAPFQRPSLTPIFLGRVPRQALAFVRSSAERAAR